MHGVQTSFGPFGQPSPMPQAARTTGPARILIVEDEPALLRGLADNFRHAGYAVDTAADGRAGLDAALDSPPDLMLLDIMLPHVNGYEVCQTLREAGLEMPVIMLTAKGQEADIVLGLNVGADDYVTKPFNVNELLARVHAMLRRARSAEDAPVTFGSFTLDIGARTLLRDGTPVELTPKEMGVLILLARRAGRPVTRDDMLDHVWGYNVLVTGRSVDRCIKTLRKKLEDDPHHPRFIETVREIGYRFATA